MNASSLTLNDWLQNATKELNQAGIGTARLDCLVLAEDATGKDRGWLLAHPTYNLKGRTFQVLNRQIRRRLRHEPLAYIRGKTEFYGREFMLNKQVLEPRPESEDMIDLLKKLARKQEPEKKEKAVVVDLGTGSGAIGITAALEFPDMEVILTDIDNECLNIAKINTKIYGAKVKLLQGDLLEPLFSVSCSVFLILANLPYVPDHYEINEAALMEPRIAIFGGPDGLGLYRRMFDQITKMPDKPQYIFTESLPFQHEDLVKIAGSGGYELKETADFIQVFSLKHTDTSKP